mmetsp:Transcript_21524/g.34630  ORF Transcript_21524/g.34630 Transcript_21524/m.34630 type:complete len:125 (+) Transcript_21524:149-523(+)
MAELMFGLSQTKKKKNEEQKVRTTKASLKEVNITDTIEKEVRKEQHQREQTWKKTGRDQIKQNTNFDMARSLFGGGGPPPAAHDDDEEEVEEHEAARQEEEEDDGGAAEELGQDEEEQEEEEEE